MTLPTCKCCEKRATVVSDIGLCPACGLQDTLVRAYAEGLVRQAETAARAVEAVATTEE